MSQDSSNIKFFSVLKLNDLPPLPSPSKWLQEILTSINFADPMYHPCKLKSRYENRKRKSKINGFIAFRSFYSRAIKIPKPQQEISASLAVAWGLEAGAKSKSMELLCSPLQWNSKRRRIFILAISQLGDYWRCKLLCKTDQQSKRHLLPLEDWRRFPSIIVKFMLWQE